MIKTIGKLPPEIEALWEECDARANEWREAHKNDPCETCGTHDSVDIIATGSLARLTPLCAGCRDRLEQATETWHAGYAAGKRAIYRLPWWKRLFR